MAKNKISFLSEFYKMTYLSEWPYTKFYGFVSSTKEQDPSITQLLNDEKINLTLSFDDKKDRRRGSSWWNPKASLPAVFDMNNVFVMKTLPKCDFTFEQSPNSPTKIAFKAGSSYHSKEVVASSASLFFNGCIDNISINNGFGFGSATFNYNNEVYKPKLDKKEEIDNKKVTVKDNCTLTKLIVNNPYYCLKNDLESFTLKDVILKAPKATFDLFSLSLPNLKSLDLTKVKHIDFNSNTYSFYGFNFDFHNFTASTPKSEKLEEDLKRLNEKINFGCQIKVDPEAVFEWSQLPEQPPVDQNLSKPKHCLKFKDVFPNKVADPMILTPFDFVEYVFNRNKEKSLKIKDIKLKQTEKLFKNASSIKEEIKVNQHIK